MEERPDPLGEGEIERRLHEALSRRADRAGYSPYAYRTVLRTAERRRRTRHRRRTIAGGAVAVSALAVPIGLGLVADSGPTEVRSPELASAGEALPRFQPEVVPNGFVLDEVVDLTEPQTDAAGDYVQVFRASGRDGRLVARQSSLPPDRLVPPENSTEVEINGAKAWLVRQDSRRASLTWADEQTRVVRQLHARSFSDVQLLDVARSLQRRTSGLGFETTALPDGLLVVSEGDLGDESTAGTVLRYDGGDSGAALDLSVRPGSELELELLRATAPEVLTLTIDGIDRILTTETAYDDLRTERHTLTWIVRPGVVVEVTGEGVDQTDLIDFARGLRGVGEQEWDSFLAAAGDAAVVVRSDETTDASGAESDRVVPGVAVEGLTSGTQWRARLPTPSSTLARRCVTLEIGATEAERCLSGRSVDAVAFDGGDSTALVVVSPNAAIIEVIVAEQPWLADGRVGELWIGWLPTDQLTSPITVVLDSGEVFEIEISLEGSATVTTPAPAGGPGIGPVVNDGGTGAGS